MKTLAIDTSTMMATCAVIDGDYLLGEFSLNQDMSHSENLIPMVKEILDNLKLQPRDIDLYGIAIGPGSFTGLRIGAATIKAFAHVFDKTIIGVSTLEALAYNLPYNGTIVPMIDARRNRVYTGVYQWEGQELKNMVAAAAIDIDELLDMLLAYEDIIVNGNGLHLYREKILDKLGDRVRLAPIGLRECKASSVAELARVKYETGIRDDYYSLVPDYLRESQAQRELRKKEG